jgi:hypothetical protein
MLTTGRRDCRCSTAGLLVVLSHLYPEYMLVFLYLLILDFASHWYHMYSARGHHKVVSADRNFLLRFYYGVYPFFGFCCVGNELFFILLYVLKFAPAALIPGIDVPVASVRHVVRANELDVSTVGANVCVGVLRIARCVHAAALLLRVPACLRVQERDQCGAAVQRSERRGDAGRRGRQQGQVGRGLLQASKRFQGVHSSSSASCWLPPML